MENIFKNISIFTPGVELNKEINREGKHVPPFDKKFPIIMDLHRFEHDFILTPNYHDYLEIGYISEGKGFLNVGNKKYVIKKDDIVIISNFEVHTFTTSKNQFFDLAVIYFMPELIFNPGSINLDFDYLKPFFYRSDNFSHIIHPEKINSSEILSLFEKIYELSNKKTSNYKLEIKIYLMEMLIKILNYYENVGIKKSGVYSKKLENLSRLKDLISYIQNDYNSAITLEEAAKMVSISTHYFCKFFKQVMGKTFINYVLSVRIDRAKEILFSEKISVTSVAYKVGFGNLSYFHRKFKEFTGFRPNEFRQKVRNNK